MPKSPLESFFDRVFEAVDEAAEDLIREANKQAKANIRRMLAQSRAANRLNQVGPLPQPKRRAPGSRESVVRPMVTTPQVTLYDVLECSPRASQETISAAFRSLSSRFHPDNGKTGNEAKYKDITAAWSILKDPGKRKKYDREKGLI